MYWKNGKRNAGTRRISDFDTDMNTNLMGAALLTWICGNENFSEEEMDDGKGLERIDMKIEYDPTHTCNCIEN